MSLILSNALELTHRHLTFSTIMLNHHSSLRAHRVTNVIHSPEDKTSYLEYDSDIYREYMHS